MESSWKPVYELLSTEHLRRVCEEVDECQQSASLWEHWVSLAMSDSVIEQLTFHGLQKNYLGLGMQLRSTIAIKI